MVYQATLQFLLTPTTQAQSCISYEVPSVKQDLQVRLFEVGTLRPSTMHQTKMDENGGAIKGNW